MEVTVPKSNIALFCLTGATDSTIEARVKALQAQLAMMPQQGEGQKK